MNFEEQCIVYAIGWPLFAPRGKAAAACVWVGHSLPLVEKLLPPAQHRIGASFRRICRSADSARPFVGYVGPALCCSLVMRFNDVVQTRRRLRLFSLAGRGGQGYVWDISKLNAQFRTTLRDA